MNAKEYILNTWEKTIRTQKEDKDTFISMPYPFSSPSSVEGFFDMYYWDTYFTNIGLILSDRLDQAKNNCMNIASLIDRYGFMPNGNRTYFLTRSQPPFFTKMIMDIYNAEKDKKWLEEMNKSAEKEYEFWQNERLAPNGLNHYFGIKPNYRDASDLCRRMGIELPDDKETVHDYGLCYRAICESGWDCSSRCGLEMHKSNTVDLNALLYGMESDLMFFARELGTGKENFYKNQAETRKEKINKLLYSESKKAYFDYNFETEKQYPIFTLASYYPMFTKLCTDEQAKALKEHLPVFEYKYGLACSENIEFNFNKQWDYPNGWAPLQYIVIKGLLNYGFEKDALRIAEKFVAMIEKIYNKTGYIWEKYNVVKGEISESEGHKAHEMMGWSSGIYLYCLDLLSKK